MTPPPGGDASRMEFQRQDLRVGAFVLVALAVFSALTAMAIHKRFFRQEYTLHTSLPRIDGLRPGGDVLLRGHTVGLVRKITLTSTPEILFEVDFSVAEQISLPIGTRARLSGNFSGTVLELVTPGDPMDPDSPPPLPPDKLGIFLEADSSVPGLIGPSLQALFTEAYAMTRQLSLTLANADSLITERLGPKVEKTLDAVTGDLGVMMAELQATLVEARGLMASSGEILDDSRPRIAALLDSARDDLEAVHGLALRLDSLMASVQDGTAPLLDNAASSVAEAGALIGRLDTAIDPEKIRAIIENLESASHEADLLMTELQRRPWRLLRRVKGEKQELLDEIDARRKAEEIRDEGGAGEGPRTGGSDDASADPPPAP